MRASGPRVFSLEHKVPVSWEPNILPVFPIVKASTWEQKGIWLGQDNSCHELRTQLHLLSLCWFLACHQNGNGQGWQLGGGPAACQRENQRSLGNKGTLPSLGLFLKRTLPAWNWLKSWTAARMAHPRRGPVASSASVLLCPCQASSVAQVWKERGSVAPQRLQPSYRPIRNVCHPTSLGREAEIMERELKGSLGFAAMWPWRGHLPTLDLEQAGYMTMTSRIIVCVLMDQGRQIWVRRVEGLGKTKNRLAAGHWFRVAATRQKAMAPPAGAKEMALRFMPISWAHVPAPPSANNTPSSDPALLSLPPLGWG